MYDEMNHVYIDDQKVYWKWDSFEMKMLQSVGLLMGIFDHDELWRWTDPRHGAISDLIAKCRASQFVESDPVTIGRGAITFTTEDAKGDMGDPYRVDYTINFSEAAEMAKKSLDSVDWGYSGKPPSPLAWFARSVQSQATTHGNINLMGMFHPDVMENSRDVAVEHLLNYLSSVDKLPTTEREALIRDAFMETTVDKLRECARIALINPKGGNLINTKRLEDLGYTFRTETGTPNLKVWLKTKHLGEICIYGYSE